MTTARAVFSHREENDKEPYHYTACGLDNIYLASGYEIEDSPYGPAVSIRDAHDLHRAIALHLVTATKELAPKEVRFLRILLDVTQAELGRMMQLGSQQIARWEKGQSKPSGSADRLLRLIVLNHLLGELDLADTVNRLDAIDENPADQRHVFTIDDDDDGWRCAA